MIMQKQALSSVVALATTFLLKHGVAYADSSALPRGFDGQQDHPAESHDDSATAAGVATEQATGEEGESRPIFGPHLQESSESRLQREASAEKKTRERGAHVHADASPTGAREPGNVNARPLRELNVVVGPEIINGVPAESGKYTFFAQSEPFFVQSVFNLCGGSLIAPNLVISTAFCGVAGAWPVGDKVIINSIHRGREEDVSQGGFSETAKIQSFVVHPEFVYPDNYPDNDVMIVVLDRDVPLQYVELAVPPYLPMDNQELTTIGFGTTVASDSSSLSDVLLEATPNFVSDTACADEWPFDVSFCAVDPIDGQAPCSGDLGGPLLDTSDQENPKLVGLYSGGDCNPGRPSFYFEIAGTASEWVTEQVCKLASAIPESVGPYCPSESPSDSHSPSEAPSDRPSEAPSDRPSEAPSDRPSDRPSEAPSDSPSEAPSDSPSEAPSDSPSEAPSDSPSEAPSDMPSQAPSSIGACCLEGEEGEGRSCEDFPRGLCSIRNGAFLGDKTSCEDEKDICERPCGAECVADLQCLSGCCLTPTKLKFGVSVDARRRGLSSSSTTEKGRCIEAKWCQCTADNDRGIGSFVSCVRPCD